MSILVSVIDGMSNATDADLSGFQGDMMLQGGVMVTNQYANALSVVQSGSPDTQSNVNSGIAYIPDAATPTIYYRVEFTDTESQTHDATSSNPRIDALVLGLDLGATPDANGGGVGAVTIVKGSESASPTAPSDGDIDTQLGHSVWIRLADIAIANPFVDIDTADITDQRQFMFVDTKSMMAGAGVNAYGYQTQNGDRELYSILDANGNIKTYDADDALVKIYVPEDGDIEQGISDGAGLNVHLGPYTYTPAAQISVSEDTRIIGAGNKLTTIDGSAFSVGSEAIFLIESGQDGVWIEGVHLDIGDTNCDVGVETNNTTANVNDLNIHNVRVTNCSAGKVGVRVRDNGNSNLGFNMFNVSVTGTAGTGFSFAACERGLFTQCYADVAAGTHWQLPLGADYNILQIVCDLAGTDSGTGNDVTEVVF